MERVSLVFFIILFYIFISGIDFIVHGVLYSYGLTFSYEWAMPYWILLAIVIFVFAIATGIAYWSGSDKSGIDKIEAICIISSISLLNIGGLLDILVYIFWQRMIPPNNLVWWWSPWYYVFGFWDFGLQLLFFTTICIIILLIWVPVIYHYRR